jgi:hypothetical protein
VFKNSGRKAAQIWGNTDCRRLLRHLLTAIKIISAPPGEAPQHIREAWIGVVLPLTVPAARSTYVIGGVLTGPRTYLGQQFRRLLGQGRREVGYIVSAADAVTLLARANPEAAEWWKQNTPHLLVSDRQLIFSVEACEEVEDIIWPPPPRSE